jgi:hypothetical protein
MTRRVSAVPSQERRRKTPLFKVFADRSPRLLAISQIPLANPTGHNENFASQGKMRVVTIVSLGASAVLGLAALVVAKTVLPGQAAAKVAGVASQQQAGVAVVVASKDMKFGDKVDADHLRLMQLPADAVPRGPSPRSPRCSPPTMAARRWC